MSLGQTQWVSSSEVCVGKSPLCWIHSPLFPPLLGGGDSVCSWGAEKVWVLPPAPVVHGPKLHLHKSPAPPPWGALITPEEPCGTLSHPRQALSPPAARSLPHPELKPESPGSLTRTTYRKLDAGPLRPHCHLPAVPLPMSPALPHPPCSHPPQPRSISSQSDWGPPKSPTSQS